MVFIRFWFCVCVSIPWVLCSPCLSPSHHHLPKGALKIIWIFLIIDRSCIPVTKAPTRVLSRQNPVICMKLLNQSPELVLLSVFTGVEYRERYIALLKTTSSCNVIEYLRALQSNFCWCGSAENTFKPLNMEAKSSLVDWIDKKLEGIGKYTARKLGNGVNRLNLF